MKYLCAYALAWLSGNTQPKASDLANIINAIGGDFDTSRAESLCDLLAERDLTNVIKAGLPKLQAFAGASSVSSAPVTTSEAPKEEAAEKKEDKKEKEEVEDIEGAMDLFGGDEW
ncbi:unnamed protein product [Blepharisma stoltei]|uniref:60S acidic ribosomal protein P2 n=1 Tax=Blepharisma stoltei TaxID=1481888 RepID=A0AAU9ILA1_9CILI|nr:unnamed protein product [Blepharisma stoltei]